MEENYLRPSGSSRAEMPAWSWLAAALLLLLFFLVLSSSGALLAPYVGQLAGATDYLHEFAHDGRHLLGVPCH
ncbi:MAG: CbtB domain-containing protein [Rubrobacter sp.]